MKSSRLTTAADGFGPVDKVGLRPGLPAQRASETWPTLDTRNFPPPTLRSATDLVAARPIPPPISPAGWKPFSAHDFSADPQPARRRASWLPAPGIVTALGLGWQTNAAGFRAGRTAFRPVTLFDVSRQRVKAAAEVDVAGEMPPLGSIARTCDGPAGPRRQSTAGATEEAWRQAGWRRRRTCRWCWARPAGGWRWGRLTTARRCRRRLTAIKPSEPLMHYQAQAQGRTVLAALGFRGPITIISNACASGANADRPCLGT